MSAEPTTSDFQRALRSWIDCVPTDFAAQWRVPVGPWLHYCRRIASDLSHDDAQLLERLLQLDDATQLEISHCLLQHGTGQAQPNNVVRQFCALARGMAYTLLTASSIVRGEQAILPALSALTQLSLACPIDALSPNPVDSIVLTDPPRSVTLLQRVTRHADYGQLAMKQEINNSGWLGFQRLLSFFLGEGRLDDFSWDASGSQIAYVLTSTAGGEIGQVCPFLLECVPSDTIGSYFDPLTRGMMVLDASAIRSLQTIARIVRDPLIARFHAEQVLTALRISPQLPLGWSQMPLKLEGASAGLTLACGAYATVRNRSLNRSASATAILSITPDALHNAPLFNHQLTADAVADASVLPKLRAARSHTPVLKQIVMSPQQADQHRREATRMGIEVVPCATFYDAYKVLTSDAELDDVLRQYCGHVARTWTRMADPMVSLEDLQEVEWRNDHRPDRYQWPDYGLLPAGKIPSDDSRRHTRTEQVDPDEGDEIEPPSDYQIIAGEAEERLLSLLSAGDRICVTEDAGAGKSVFSLITFSIASSPLGWGRLFHHLPPLVVRLEGDWPTDEKHDPHPVSRVLQSHLSRVLPTHDAQLLQRVVIYAIETGRVMMILDAWDQCSEVVQQHLAAKVFGVQSDLSRHGNRVLVTSRAYAIQPYQQSVFKGSTWRFARIEGFSESQQDTYMSDLEPRWREMVPDRSAVAELLRLPDVLRMLRRIVEMSDAQGPLPRFRQRGDLYFEVSQRLLQRALSRQGVVQTPDQLRLLRKTIATVAFQMMLEERYNYAVYGRDAEQLLQAAYQRFRAGSNTHESLRPEDDHAWSSCLSVLKTTEWTQRCIFDVWHDNLLSFRSRKVMEWYAASYLSTYATPDTLRSNTASQRPTVHFINNRDWYWVWRFAIEMPTTSCDGSPISDPNSQCHSLALLFEIPHQGRRPTELMYRCWHLFETEQEPKIRDKFPTQLPLPGADRIVSAWRWQFWSQFQNKWSLAEQHESLRLFYESDLLGLLHSDHTHAMEGDGYAFTPSQLSELRRLLNPFRHELLRRCRWLDRKHAVDQGWLARLVAKGRRLWKQTTVSATHDPAYRICPTVQQDHCIFWMGGSAGDGEANVRELPRHQVQVDPFAMMTFSVTETQLSLFSDADLVSDRNGPIGDKPAIDVDWYSAWMLSKWLGPNYRLPTEAEREFAARGGTSTRFWWGDEFNPRHCNSQESQVAQTLGRTETSEEYRNPYGLYHIVGNIYEWCFDFYESRLYRKRTGVRRGNVAVLDGVFPDDAGPPTGSSRVVRGGFFAFASRVSRCSRRYHVSPENNSSGVGVRIVRSSVSDK